MEGDLVKHQIHHSGNRTFRAYRDDRGWYDIENQHTRNLTIVQDQDWDDFVSIVNLMDRTRKKEVKG